MPTPVLDREIDRPARATRAKGVPRLPPHVERRHLALAAAGCVGLGLVALIDPNERAIGPPCPLRALTGLDCPLCGATRATRALVHGDIWTAMDHNALYVLSLPLMGLVVLLWLVRGHIPDWARRPSTTWSVAVTAGVFAVARNLPFEALSILGSSAGGQ